MNTGEELWVYDAFAAVWGSAFVVDGKVFLGDEDGDVVVVQHGRELKVLSEMNMNSSVYSTPVPANASAAPPANSSGAITDGTASCATSSTSSPAKPRTPQRPGF